jgi:hypothetical protein
MLTLKTFGQLNDLTDPVYEPMKQLLRDIVGPELGSSTDPDTFEFEFGGDWLVAERPEDLAFLEKYSDDQFDIVEWIGEMLNVVSITNNAGGISYFVPRTLLNERLTSLAAQHA